MENINFFIEKVQEIYKNKKISPKAKIVTFGCQQNVADSDKFRGMLDTMGFDFTENDNDADVIVFNTCAVRQNAENRAWGNIGRLKSLAKKNPNLIIAVCGCMTSQSDTAKKLKKDFPFVNFTMETSEISCFPKFLYNSLEKKSIINIISNKPEIFEDISAKRDAKIKAFLPIMQGCDNFCSYCIVPYVRGREVSRTPENILKEFQNLIKSGYKDITLLGQNVNSYGKNLNPKIDFPDLLKILDDQLGDFRIRFMTSHPKDCSKKLIDTIAESKHICYHIHLPLQCGSNKILNMMNRKYSRENYLEIVSYAKEKIPNLTLTSDIIVGYPGETYEDFKQTLDIIEKVEFTSLFTFIYSPRNGTPAALLPDLIAKEEKTNWLSELIDLQKEISEKMCKNYVGKKLRVLAENKSLNGNIIAKTDGNIMVEIETQKNLFGQFIDCEIIDAKRESLVAKLI